MSTAEIARPIVGVDIDGVLANQVDGVLARVNSRRNLSLKYEDVDHWDARLGADTTFTAAIAEAFRDPTYVSEMPVHPGAAEMLLSLREVFTVVLITARPPAANEATVRWLRRNGLPYDHLRFSGSGSKAGAGAVVLIDDFPPTLDDFISKSGGLGILVEQPWNRGAAPTVSRDRMVVASSLADATRLAIDYSVVKRP